MISPTIGEQLLAIYRTLIPLNEGVRAFLAGDPKVLSSSSLHTSSIGTYDDRLGEELDYEAALRKAQGRVVFTPDSAYQYSLGHVHLDMGQAQKALESLQEAYLLLKRKHGDRPHPDVASSLNSLGMAYRDLGEYRRAIEYHEQSLAMFKQIHSNRPHPDLSTSLMNLSYAYLALGETGRAIRTHEQSLAMKKQLYGDRPHTDVAFSLACLGNAYLKSGNRSKAIELLEKGYELFLKTVGAEHPHAKWTKERRDAPR